MKIFHCYKELNALGDEYEWDASLRRTVKPFGSSSKADRGNKNRKLESGKNVLTFNMPYFSEISQT